ncbi:hypothetical protein [Pseudochelatococcus sp. G4_1912]|uniref:hypothetical protein n=1 Tax=Pseudochelatococcus sp. G4_1912 TaxID=3114288 RepID=UPI0039C6B72A
MTEIPDVVSRSQFAALCGVSPGRVTQWVKARQIDDAALDGSGRGSKIRVKIAAEQLGIRLNVNQRFGLNGIGTRLPLEEDEAPELKHVPLIPVEAPKSTASTIESRIAAEKLAQAEMTTARMQREEMAARGVYAVSKVAEAEMVRLAASMLTVFEGALSDFASAIAGQFELPSRDVLHLLRQQFREVRERAAATCQLEMEGLPEFIEAPDSDDTSVVE